MTKPCQNHFFVTILPDFVFRNSTMPEIYRPSAGRKQDHRDFQRRVKRIDPRFFRMGHTAYVKDDTKPRVISAALTGFGWAYLIFAIGENRAQVEASLLQGSLSAEAQYWVISALAAAIAASLVMLAAHLIRVILTTGPRRQNSRALLLGAVAALSLFHTPDIVWTTGFDLLDGHSQNALATVGDVIQDAFPSIGLTQFSFGAYQ